MAFCAGPSLYKHSGYHNLLSPVACHCFPEAPQGDCRARSGLAETEMRLKRAGVGLDMLERD